MKILITLLKPLSFLPALLMMYIIFSFSAQPGEVSGNLSYKISYEIIETKSELLSENLSSEEIAYKADGIHYYVRKAAHMTEYFLSLIFRKKTWRNGEMFCRFIRIYRRRG